MGFQGAESLEASMKRQGLSNSSWKSREHDFNGIHRSYDDGYCPLRTLEPSTKHAFTMYSKKAALQAQKRSKIDFFLLLLITWRPSTFPRRVIPVSRAFH